MPEEGGGISRWQVVEEGRKVEGQVTGGEWTGDRWCKDRWEDKY